MVCPAGRILSWMMVVDHRTKGSTPGGGGLISLDRSPYTPLPTRTMFSRAPPAESRSPLSSVPALFCAWIRGKPAAPPGSASMAPRKRRSWPFVKVSSVSATLKCV